MFGRGFCDQDQKKCSWPFLGRFIFSFIGITFTISFFFYFNVGSHLTLIYFIKQSLIFEMTVVANSYHGLPIEKAKFIHLF